MKEYPHILPRIVKGKRWYIKYGVWDDRTKSIFHKKYYRGINTIDDEYKRELHCRDLINEIKSILPHLVRNKQDEEKKTDVRQKKFNSTKEAIDFILALKYEGDDHKKTYNSYKSNSHLFVEWLKKNRLNHLVPEVISKSHVQEYIDYLVTHEKLSATTINNRLACLNSIWNQLIKRKILSENPFSGGLDKPKKRKTNKNMAYDHDHLIALKEAILDQEPGLWRVVQFIYYTYMRPVEILRLKVKNVLIDEQKLYVPGEISKNKTEAFLNIPDPLMIELEKMELERSNKENFLFTKNWKPGPQRVGYNYFGDKHRKVLRSLKFPPEYTLYSWKHTGVVNAYKAGVDIKSIQMQCRHSSIEMTDNYLKSLGFVDNDVFAKGIPEI